MDPSKGTILVYKDTDGTMKLDVRLQDETVWLTQEDMSRLFGKAKSTINEHIKKIFAEGELPESDVIKKFGISEFQHKTPTYYNLDVIISVGYRVKSLRGTQFRMWATQRLREYIVKGFALNDKRLKDPEGGRYFEELLARIRDIRSSEKIFWRKVLDIYATSIDYDPHAAVSQDFFKQVQNKMHWAAHGHTAAEIIYHRADADKDTMGITNYPGNKVLKRDTEIAKNYLSEAELNVLNRIVTAYLEMAELQALNRNPMTMVDWIERLQQFLTMSGRELLTNAGTVSHEAAIEKAHHEYERFRLKQIEEPTEVERHFVEAEAEIRRLSSDKENEKAESD